ncbi:HPP family protein [Cordyceps fumosorosea ARSEF 2679]|uniref:HPP family protein n=1 Tax=Cordyceps fumosorosea (strain ARSEF 2679) TaxID=1081104 RepID=A0A167NMU3_CORFA|nr:HPP family protein [Cordyceps fumosorosea ARSEF 2679]OAA55728.1 HPP family protein [Cordyceps fumosorosea ARSEF 2679]
MRRPNSHHAWNFDIDRYLDPIVPAPPWRYLPYPVAHFLGYRKTKPANTGNIMPTFWAFIGIFCAIIIVQVVSTHIPSFESHHVPAIVGSFGATAVLEFYAIESPLAQPRNAFIGQLLASVIGVAVAKLFLLSNHFDSIQYVGGALACAATTSLMALTKTVHPPAGATALLAVVDDRLLGLGWFLIPVMALGCTLMVAVALVVNNIERRFPVYWWTPETLHAKRPILHRAKEEDPESLAPAGSATTAEEPKTIGSETEDGAEPSPETLADILHRKHEHNEVVIRPGDVVVPQEMYLTQEEVQLLETLSRRL